MALRSLNEKILKLIGGLLFLATFAILLAVWFSINSHADKQLERELQVGKRVFLELLENREKQLLSSAEILTADFGFKQAVATRDQQTIVSVLENHGSRISADLMVLLSLQGELLATSSNNFQLDELPDVSKVMDLAEQGSGVVFLKIQDKLYQCIFLTVNAPTPIAKTMIGFEIDQTFVTTLTTITNLDVSIQLSSSNQSELSISSLPAISQQTVLDGNNSNSNRFSSIAVLSGQSLYASESFILSSQSDIDHQVRVTLSRNLNDLFSGFNALQIRIAFISLLSIGLALILGVVFSKSLSRPLSEFSRLAKKIAKGEFSGKLETKLASREMDELATAFSAMQHDILTRQQEIEYQATHDATTGLFNRFKISSVIQEKIEASQHFQLIGIKITNFQEINNAFGFSAADICLKSLAQRLGELGGIAAKLESDSLMWIPLEQIKLTELFIIRGTLEKTHSIDGTLLSTKIALGEIQVDESSKSKDILRHLNIAVEHASYQLNLYQLFTHSLETDYAKRLDLLRELEFALSSKREEFSMFYQPKLQMKTNEVTKLEALIRWNSVKLGFVSPEVFIPIAEKSGLISKITDWVISEVIQDVSTWQAAGINIQVAINISALDITDGALLPATLGKLENKALKISTLSFEITESEIMKDAKKAIEHLHVLKNNGFSLSIDDFGTGYSSFAYLKHLPVNEIKIDKSFVMELETQLEDQKIVKTMISLAQSLNLDVVAEGVESLAALELLRQWGCHWAQGYYLSRPMPAKSVAAWLIDFKKKQDEDASDL